MWRGAEGLLCWGRTTATPKALPSRLRCDDRMHARVGNRAAHGCTSFLGSEAAQAGCNQLVASMVLHNEFQRAAPLDAAYNCTAACHAPSMEVVCCHHSMQCQLADATALHVKPMHRTLKSGCYAPRRHYRCWYRTDHRVWDGHLQHSM